MLLVHGRLALVHHDKAVASPLLLRIGSRLVHLEVGGYRLVRNFGSTHGRCQVHRLDRLKIVGSSTSDTHIEIKVLDGSTHIDSLIYATLVYYAVAGLRACLVLSVLAGRVLGKLTVTGGVVGSRVRSLLALACLEIGDDLHRVAVSGRRRLNFTIHWDWSTSSEF